jgi:hypothetical protein
MIADAMTMQNLSAQPLVAWGLADLLVLMLAILAYLRKRRLVKERLAILIIVVAMLLALLALTVHIE